MENVVYYLQILAYIITNSDIFAILKKSGITIAIVSHRINLMTWSKLTDDLTYISPDPIAESGIAYNHSFGWLEAAGLL